MNALFTLKLCFLVSAFVTMLAVVLLAFVHAPRPARSRAPRVGERVAWMQATKKAGKYRKISAVITAVSGSMVLIESLFDDRRRWVHYDLLVRRERAQ